MITIVSTMYEGSEILTPNWYISSMDMTIDTHCPNTS